MPWRNLALWLCGWLVAALWLANAFAAECQLQSTAASKEVLVKTVIDGDTVRLSDNQLVRFIGVNTPEIDHKFGHSEPHAEQARDFLQSILERQQYHMLLQFGDHDKDHYGRLLAHTFTRDGDNIQAQILQAGLGVWIIMPPNLHYMDCYQHAEHAARRRHLAVWKDQFAVPRDVNQLTIEDTGFQWIRGKITRIGEGKQYLWLGFAMRAAASNQKDDNATPQRYKDIALRLNKDDLHYFNNESVKGYLNKTVRVKGWLTLYKQQLVMSVFHPAAIEIEQ